jgi:hypothetical protein
VPDTPAAVSTALADAAARISWTAPSNNYKTISAYDIEIKVQDGSSYQAVTAYCDGTSAAVVSGLYCDVPVSVLRASPYSLDVQNLVVARVRAINELGAGSYSPDNAAGALIETEPTAMASPTSGSSTDTSRIELNWALLASPHDGYSPVTTYALQWDAGLGDTYPWVDLVGVTSDYLLSSYTVTAGITAGSSYRFQIRAVNFWGAGAYSPVTTVVAATTPAQPSAPTTSIESAAGSVVISWLEPSNRGAMITSYTVKIQTATGT